METDEQNTKTVQKKKHPLYESLMLAQTGAKAQNGSQQKLNLKTKNKLRMKVQSKASSTNQILAGLDAE